MAFSQQILKNIKNKLYGDKIISYPVSKSSAGIKVGDILVFKYKLLNRVKERTVLVVRPVEKDAKTGNSLLTCVKVTLPNEITLDYIKNLYTDRRSLGEDQYRTYIMSKIIGNPQKIDYLKRNQKR